MTNLSQPLWVACATDPAFVDGPELVTYIRSRSIADLAAVPLKDAAQQPVLVQLQPLTATLRCGALGFPNEPQRRLAACRYAARRVIAGGWRIEAGAIDGSAEDLDAAEVTITEKGVARLLDLVGGDGIEELGSLAIQRATVHPRATAPFRLPSLSGGV